jgi:hypothetical protein
MAKAPRRRGEVVQCQILRGTTKWSFLCEYAGQNPLGGEQFLRVADVIGMASDVLDHGKFKSPTSPPPPFFPALS